jgi:hypothetical protein
VYSNGDLCLYLPGQWKESMLLADTILPWTSQWLLLYELWLITGHWMGTGHDHPVAGLANRPSRLADRKPWLPGRYSDGECTDGGTGGQGDMTPAGRGRHGPPVHAREERPSVTAITECELTRPPRRHGVRADRRISVQDDQLSVARRRLQIDQFGLLRRARRAPFAFGWLRSPTVIPSSRWTSRQRSPARSACSSAPRCRLRPASVSRQRGLAS